MDFLCSYCHNGLASLGATEPHSIRSLEMGLRTVLEEDGHPLHVKKTLRTALRNWVLKAFPISNLKVFGL